ncbi:hypothetical protein ANCDUO_04511 [Ancylostoma duodenale]|uniref:Uncharacterized protein n=1 Tax=Ancylostoma duodenale TaxID=51022 RepID=A0A0C2GUS3_9BILA|nr:hypothetical protein ANCDUO_04511 [Ancylostoma duodenale]
MEIAKEVYKELLRGRKRICHDHYMQAEAVTLNCDDIARFFYECLMKYYNSTNGWSVNEIPADPPRKEEDSTPGDDEVKIIEPCTSNDSSLDDAPTVIVKPDEDAGNVLVLPGKPMC